MKKSKGNFIFNDSKRKYSLRKISGIGVVSALIGIMSFSSVISSSVSASEAKINVNYHYVSTDELSKEEMNLVVNELPKDLVDGSNLFVIYKINSNDSLPNTGSTALNLASIIGAGLVLIGFQINKSGDKKKRIVKNILLISLVGGAFTVKSVSAFTISSLANYNHVEKISVGMSIPDGKINISGYHFVGYIDGKNVKFTDNTITNSSKEDTVNSVNEVSSTETKYSVQSSASENSKELVTKAKKEETVKEKVVQQETQKNEEKKPIQNTNEMNKEVHHSNLNDLYDNGGENSNTEMNPHDGASSKTNNNLQPKVIKRVIKVDEEGKTIENITGYTKVFEDQPVETKEIIGGQETTVLTIKEHYKAEKVINEKHPIDSKLTNVPIPTTLVEILSEEIVDNLTENVNKDSKEDKEVLKDSEGKKVTELIESSLNTSTNKVDKATTTNNESGTNIHSNDKAISVTEEKEEKKETNSPTEKVTLNNVDKKENTIVVENNTSKPKENNEVSKPADNVASINKKEEPKTTIHKVVRIVRTTEEIPFKLTVKKDNTLAEGENRVEAEGKIGKKTTIHKITLVNNIEEKKDLLLETTDEAENRVIVVGTKKNNAASNENKEKVTDDVSNDNNKVESNQTLLTTDYTVEIINSKNNTVIKNREEIAEIVKNRNLSLNLEKLDKDKSIQTKVIEIKDSTLEEGKRQLQDVQASYVTVNVRKKEDTLNNNEKNELVTSLDIPLITKVYHVGTKNINFPRKDIVVSGHAYDSKREALENATVGVYKDDKLISNVNTDVDGYTFTHLLSNQTYVLKSKDFEAKIITITNSEPIVQNITGKFELGKKYSDDMVNYHLKSNVINVDDGQYQTNTDDGKKVVLSKEIDARVGDIMIIPPSKNYETPKAIKVTSVNHVNNETVIEYSAPSLYEVINNISTKSWKTDISRATFIPAEGVKVEEVKNSDGNLFNRITLFDKKIKSLKLPFSKKLKGDIKVDGSVEFNINGKVSSEAMDINFATPKIDFMNFDLTNNLNFTAEGTLTISKTIEEEELAFDIGKFILPTSIPGVAVKFDLQLVYTFDGKLTVKATSDYTLESTVKLNNWKPEFSSKVDHKLSIGNVDAEAKIKTGPKISGAPTVFMVPLISASAKAGVGLEGTFKGTALNIEHKEDLINNEGSITSRLGEGELTLEKFGYVNLGVKLDILEEVQKVTSSLKNLKTTYTLYDKIIPISKETFKKNAKEANIEKLNSENSYKIFDETSKLFRFAFDGGSRWESYFWLLDNGKFEGFSYSVSAGTPNTNYSRWEINTSQFRGKFADIKKINEYEYQMTISDFYSPVYQSVVNGVKITKYHPFEFIKNGMLIEKFVLYLPGKKVSELPKDLSTLIPNFEKHNKELLSRAVFYIKDANAAFYENFSYGKINNEFQIGELRKYLGNIISSYVK